MKLTHLEKQAKRRELKKQGLTSTQVEEELRKMYPEELVKAWLDGDWDVMEGGNFLFPYAQIRQAVNREL